MKKMIINYNNELETILLEYYTYLMNNCFDSDKSFDYIFSILELLEINPTYLKTISFDNSIKTQGIYIPEEKTIILNTSTIKACNSLGYINRQEMILSYFNLLFHEITHVFQKIYKENYYNDISKVLGISDNLKFLSNNGYDLYSLFPDEINANINASVILYNLGINNELIGNYKYLEKSLIYYLTLGLFHNKQIINSQLKYLHKLLLDIDFDEDFNFIDENDHLYLGLTKSEYIMNCLLNSYQTQNLCFDINGKGGFGYEQGNKQKKLCRLYE